MPHSWNWYSEKETSWLFLYGVSGNSPGTCDQFPQPDSNAGQREKTNSDKRSPGVDSLHSLDPSISDSGDSWCVFGQPASYPHNCLAQALGLLNSMCDLLHPLGWVVL